MTTFTEEFRAVVQEFLLVSITISSFSYKRNKHFLEMFEYGGTHLKTVHFKLEHTHFLNRPLPAYISIYHRYVANPPTRIKRHITHNSHSRSLKLQQTQRVTTVPLVLLWTLLWGTWWTGSSSSSASAAPTTSVWWPTATGPTSGVCADVATAPRLSRPET